MVQNNVSVDKLKAVVVAAFKKWEIGGKKPLSLIIDGYADRPDNDTAFNDINLIGIDADGLAQCVAEEVLATPEYDWVEQDILAELEHPKV